MSGSVGPVVVLAKQRSGTHLLRSRLLSSRSFFDCGEVFYLDPSTEQPLGAHNYFRYREDAVAEDPSLTLPTLVNAEALLGGFIRQLSAAAPADRLLLLDIKYNSTHHFNPAWHEPLECPHLLVLLDRHEVPIIHLVRRNVLLTCLSSRIAAEHGVFNVRQQDDFDPGKIHLDPQWVVGTVEAWQREIDWFSAHLERFERVCTVTYEQLAASSDGIPRELRSFIGSTAGVDLPAHLTSTLKKMVPRPQDVIENFSSVADALERAGYGRFLRDIVDS